MKRKIAKPKKHIGYYLVKIGKNEHIAFESRTKADIFRKHFRKKGKIKNENIFKQT